MCRSAFMKFFKENETTFSALQVTSITIESLSFTFEISALLGQLTVGSTKHFKKIMSITLGEVLMLIQLLRILVHKPAKTVNVTVVA